MLRNVTRVELVRIPVLVMYVIPSAFKCVEDVKMENAGKLESVKELKEAIERRRREEEERRREEEERRREEEERRREEEERRKRQEEKKRREEEEERRRKEEDERIRRQEEERRRRAAEERKRKEREEAAAMARRKAVISCKRDWDCVDKRVGVIEVSDKCCNEEGLTELDLSGFVNLRELKVGNGCFENVNEVKLIGLSELESVEIGMNSFTKFKNTWYDIRPDPNRHFYLKNCPKLKSLKMGRYSFSDYTVTEIENVDALEVIEIGDVNSNSANFDYASLELKSILIHNE